MSLVPPPSPFISLETRGRTHKVRPTQRVAFVETEAFEQHRSPRPNGRPRRPSYNFAGLKTTAGLAAGTLVRTTEFEVPVETLQVGDIVMTEDHGAQPIRWISRATGSGLGEAAPVRIANRALGNVGALVVSPHHRVILAGWRSKKIAGAKEVFTAAQHVVNGRDIMREPQETVTYYHLAFDRHELVQANGMLVESWHPEVAAIETLPQQIRKELNGILPAGLQRDNAYGPVARPEVKPYEARLIRP